MLAQENPIMAEATNTIRKLTEDEKVREACFWRNEQLAREEYMKQQLAEKDNRIAELEKQLEELKSQNK